jgi:glycosyltransferase involved in cell wall biosynthesis
MRKYFFKRLLAKFAIKRADYFISVSEAIADKLIEYGIPKDHILINPIGVDTTLFSPLDFSSKKQKIQIVSTRRLEPVLNVKQLINSLPFLFANRKDFCVVIIGTGSEYERIKKSIKNYRLEENVRLLGRVSFPILLDTLKKSQIFISMSHSDGAPVSLFEAMACGCFPIVSDTPANKAWIQDGINGFLVPLGDHKKLGNRIIEAADNPILLNKARLINRQIVEDRLEFSKLMDNLIINLEKKL